MPVSVSRRLGHGVAWLACVYGALLLVIGLWPTHVDQGIDVLTTWYGRWLLERGLTPLQVYDLVEGAANVAMYVPLGVIVAAVLPRWRWWGAVAAGLVTSTAIELAQAVARPGRTAALIDVVHNTLGAAIGAALVLLALQLRRPARER